MTIGDGVRTVMVEYITRFPIRKSTEVLKDVVLPLASEVEVTRIDDGHVGESSNVDSAFANDGIYFIRITFPDESIHLAVVENRLIREKFIKGCK